jgi:hypothetical protein
MSALLYDDHKSKVSTEAIHEECEHSCFKSWTVALWLLRMPHSRSFRMNAVSPSAQKYVKKKCAVQSCTLSAFF